MLHLSGRTVDDLSIVRFPVCPLKIEPDLQSLHSAIEGKEAAQLGAQVDGDGVPIVQRSPQDVESAERSRGSRRRYITNASILSHGRSFEFTAHIALPVR